jgi:hypothetical protein
MATVIVASVFPVNLEFFTNGPDPAPGQGIKFFGDLKVPGPGIFIVIILGSTHPNEWITATATDPNNNTSPFSSPFRDPEGSFPSTMAERPKETAGAQDFQLLDDLAVAAALLAATPSRNATKWAAPTPAGAVAPRLDSAPLDQFFAALNTDGQRFALSSSEEFTLAMSRLKSRAPELRDDWLVGVVGKDIWQSW